MPEPGDLVAGKYVVDQLLGEGGMGAVFAATHRLTGKQVALKWMLPELARDEDAVHRFMREAQAAGRINHPNVVDVYDVGQHEDSFFLVMELLRGEPLTTALSRRDLSVREVLELLLRAMRGVSAAHRQGVVHRDLKPDNIFLAYEADGSRLEPKVLDFGISKVSNEEQINPRLTRTGAVVGTPYYMSPEQIRGSDTLDRRADVYAFGVILYEALTGQVPFVAHTYGALVLEIATGTPTPPSELVPGLPVELSQVVMRAMARHAPDRYPDIEALIEALEPFLQGVPRRSQVTTSPPRQTRIDAHTSSISTPFTSETAAKRSIGRPTGKGFLLGIGAAVVAVAGWLVIQQSRTPALPVVAPATVGPIRPDASLNALQPPAAATAQPAPVAPADPGLPNGVSTPPSNARSQRPPASAADSRKSSARWQKPDTRSLDVKPRHQRPSPASRPNRRARSGPLNVDEF